MGAMISLGLVGSGPLPLPWKENVKIKGLQMRYLRHGNLPGPQKVIIALSFLCYCLF